MKSFWNSKKVLITGASGFIGSHVLKRLLREGSNITAAVSPNFKQSKEYENIPLVKADLTNGDECLKIAKGKDIILNFAALDGGTIFKKAYPADIFKTNTQITLNLLESAHVQNIDRILLMSSIMIYPKDAKSPVVEEDFSVKLFENTEGYVWSKRFTEIAARLYASQYKTKIAIARAGNIYGTGDTTGIEKGRVVPTFIREAMAGRDIHIIGNGSQKKSFLYIDDLVEGLLNLTEQYPMCDPVNIASEQYISLTELAKLIIKKTNSSSEIIYQDNFLSYKDIIIDVEKAKKMINFKEKLKLEEGLEKVINFFLETYAEKKVH